MLDKMPCLMGKNTPSTCQTSQTESRHLLMLVQTLLSLGRKTSKQAMQKMMDPQKFNSTLPLGTLDISHPRLRPVRGYWRGPVWVDQVYFGITGLRNYGFDREADILTEKFINNAQGLTTDGPIHENYNPLTGEALNSPNFGWSSACIIKMLLDE